MKTVRERVRLVFHSIFILKALRALILVGVVVGLGLASCQNAGDSSIEILGAQDMSKAASNIAVEPKHWETLAIASDKQLVNKDLIALAKAAAVAVDDDAVRQALHSAVLQRFDGDFDVLWTDLNSDIAISNRARQNAAQNWTHLIAQKADKSVLSSADAVTAAVRRATQEYHANVHLFWFEAEKWDKKTVPIVAFVPVGCDPEKENIILSGYDAKGNKYAVDKEFALQRPVIVINANERTNPDGTVLEAYKHSVNEKQGKGIAATQSSSYLELVSTQWYSNYAEGWFNGNPEFWAEIFSVDANNPSTTAGKWGQWYCSVDWWRCNGEVIPWPWPWQRGASWNQAQYKTLAFQWFERDPGTSFEWSVVGTFKLQGGSSIVATGKVTGTDKDDVLGYALVEHTDTHRAYNTGAPNFVLNW